MAEVLGILTGAAATIQQCISLFQFIQSATNSRKHLCDFINQHYKEITRTSRLIGVVRKEKALQTPVIISALKDVTEAGKKLNARLRSAERSLKKSHIRLIGNALFPDLEEERELQAEWRELELAKDNLNSFILLYSISLARDISNSIDVQATSIDRLDRGIKAVLHTRDPVQIKTMSETGEEREEIDGDLMDTDQPDQSRTCTSTPTATSSRESSTVYGPQRATRKKFLPKDDIEENVDLSVSEFTLSDSSSRTFSSTTSSTASSAAVSNSRATKSIKRNRTKSDSMMFNAPVSEIDDWKGDNVTIKKNVAGKGSTMFNYPNPQDFLLEVARIRSNREPVSKKLSFLSRK